jgi:actin-related protein
MFNPTLFGMDFPGIHELTFKSINSCDSDLDRELYGNIILAGGNTLFQGMQERLKKEIQGMAPSTVNVRVVASPERKFSTWIGGSI